MVGIQKHFPGDPIKNFDGNAKKATNGLQEFQTEFEEMDARFVQVATPKNLGIQISECSRFGKFMKSHFA
jgi:hypothetical protein